MDISIPLNFNGPQPSAFGVAAASSTPFRAGAFVGSVEQGGSCNCETMTFTPHCNGTHTEGIGHLTKNRVPVPAVPPVPATVVSVSLVPGVRVTDSYTPAICPGDSVITRAALANALIGAHADFLQALIIRTLPNPPTKKARDYGKEPSPYLSREAMQLLVEKGVRHLVVDFPSVDRADDDGHLTCHRIFWGVAPGVVEAEPSPKTITELAWVPDSVADGACLLNLQVAPFVADAAPSRPVLYKVYVHE